MIKIPNIALATILAAPVAVFGLAANAKTIVETAQEAGQFGTLLQAAEAAGLVETLSGDGPYTVFAPTDEAFAQLPEGQLEELLLPENSAQLTEILTYHVVPDKLMGADIVGKMKELETVQGGTLDVDSAGRTTKIDEAVIVQADIEASNGVIHVIDRVILPN